jgi:hypothetical protein
MFKLLCTLLFLTVAGTSLAISQDQFSYEELEELARQGVFKPQYVIPIQLTDHPVLVLLKGNGLFDLTSEQNQLMLPVDRDLAAKMRLSRYAETPLASYLDGVKAQLDNIWAAAEASRANSGDDNALQLTAKHVTDLQYTLKAALINGDVFVAE